MATVRTRSYFTNLFITGYKPTQTNYADLFLTVPMKKEIADRARVTTGSSSLETEVGLVVLATDAQAKANTAQLTDRSLVVQPSQLPTVVAKANSTSEDMPTTVLESIADVAVTTRNKYDIRPTSSWVTWLLSRLFKSGGTAGQVPKKTDGTDYNWGWSTLTIAETSGTVPINRGGTGQITANAALNALLPAQVANKPLVSDGTNTSFTTLPITGGGTGAVTAAAGRVALLPSMTGNTLKVLRVNAGETDYELTTPTVGDIYKTTSTTSLLIEFADKTFTVASGLSYQIGVKVRASSAASSSNYMEGFVTSYSGTSLIIRVDTIGGSGTYADWNINIGSAGINPWIQISAITATDFSAMNLYYRKDSSGRVMFKGRVRADAGITGGQTQELFTLPAGYAPVLQQGFRVPSFLNTLATTQREDCIISVETTGTVYLILGSTETNFNSYDFMLNSITFTID